MDQVLGEQVVEGDETADQRGAEKQKAEAEHLEQQGFHVVQRRQLAHQTARMMAADGVILPGQHQSLQSTEQNQAVGNDRQHDMSGDGRCRCQQNHMRRGNQRRSDGSDSGEREHQHAQAVQWALQAGDEDLDADQPADQRKGIEETEIEPAVRQVDGLTQLKRLDQDCEQGRTQRHPAA